MTKRQQLRLVKKSEASRQKLYFLLDLLCCIGIVAAGLYMKVGPINELPSVRGFYCNDNSLNKPYRAEDKVPTTLTLVIGLSAGITTIVVCEVVSNFVFKREVERIEGRLSLWPFQFCVWQPWLRRLFLRVFIFLAGAVITNLFTQIGKLTIGRLRPHFLSVCKPDYSRFNCSDGYIVADVCTGDPRLITEARKSFPSGHASFSAYFMVFLVVYLEAMIPSRRTVFFKPFLQIGFLTMGILTSLSRVYDYRHHWGDVLTGLVLGTIVALFVTLRMLSLFKRRQRVHLEELVNRGSDTGATAVADSPEKRVTNEPEANSSLVNSREAGIV